MNKCISRSRNRNESLAGYRIVHKCAHWMKQMDYSQWSLIIKERGPDRAIDIAHFGPLTFAQAQVEGWRGRGYEPFPVTITWRAFNDGTVAIETDSHDYWYPDGAWLLQYEARREVARSAGVDHGNDEPRARRNGKLRRK